ncbi:hypothetical protein Tco_0154078 [Tanacetum coccineum]
MSEDRYSPKAHHRTPVYSKDSNKDTRSLQRQPRPREMERRRPWFNRHRDMKGASYIRTLDSRREVPKQKELKLKQEGVNNNLNYEAISPALDMRGKEPFTPRIPDFSLMRTRMPSHVKKTIGSGDPERWYLTSGLPKESMRDYELSKTAFRENNLQQNNDIKDPVELHSHQEKSTGESTENSWKDIRQKSLDVEGNSECMKNLGFITEYLTLG